MNKDMVRKLQNLGKNFNLLYVEDEEEIRSIMEMVLKRFFNKVYLATNGKEGLEIFKSKKIDIILTDIEMPIMNGLDLTKHIREISYDIPIGIISAFNDTNKLTTAIQNGVNRYMLKPIDQEQMLSTIYDMLEALQNKLDAKAYHVKLQDEKISQAVKETANYFLQSIPSPIFVANEANKIIYLNSVLNNMLLEKEVTLNIGDDVELLKNSFLGDGDFTKSEKMKFLTKDDKLYFMPFSQQVEIPTIDGKSTIVVLNDITTQVKQIYMIEYQKNKLKSTQEILEEFLSKNVFTSTKEEKIAIDEKLQQSEFSQNDELLRRSHIYKISARDYISTLSDTIEDDLNDLNEIELDIQSELYEFEYSYKHESLMTISSLFKMYSKSLMRLIEFSDLADIVDASASYLKELTQEHIDSNSYMIKAVLQSILNDLSKWKEHVFIAQSTDDIHYLDSSLYNTIIELKRSFEEDNSKNEDEIDDDDDDDLEFF